MITAGRTVSEPKRAAMTMTDASLADAFLEYSRIKLVNAGAVRFLCASRRDQSPQGDLNEAAGAAADEQRGDS